VQFLVILDFHMIIDDGISCVYNYDGRIGVDAQRLGMAYVAAIIELETGALYYMRTFDVKRGSRLPAILDVRDSVEERRIMSEPCFCLRK
jgi:hypothetical protein